ncbi:MAG: 7-cyano-7-deazaguanine synthase QueC [Ignisphaera sp.]|nr:7-cyano-7-deazaguanine synthase QueC [Ignisphaera sp.]
MKDTLLILSGGMDSTVALHEYQDKIGLAVTFNYGSNHASREIEKAIASCKELSIPHVVVDMREAFKGFKSGLLSGAEAIPEGHYSDATMAATVVPFRNGIMLSVAAGIAESNDLERVMLASHAGDHAVYPDCRPEFNLYMSMAMREGTSNGVTLFAPFGDMTKREIGILGDELGVQWSKTYSCYKGGEIHCGKCSTCVERLEALDGLFDDTSYEDAYSWKEVVKAHNV